MSNVVVFTFVTTFLASAVEAIEMVTIVVGVGATRGWRSTLIGAGAGFLVPAVSIAVVGVALQHIPIGAVRLVVGSLLLIFGLQWYRKGIRRVAARGFAGIKDEHFDEAEWHEPGMDWTAFVLAFKGVALEGLEIAFIVVSFGANTNHYDVAVIGAVAAVVIIGGIGASIHPLVRRIPRSVLQLVVGIMLTSFGSFWALEGLGVNWPGNDAAILGLIVVYLVTGLGYIALEKQRAFGLNPGT
jgi:uncharacterized membrane protein